MTYLGHNKNFPWKSKSHFYPLINDCNQVQFQKNLMKRFREKFKNLGLGPKNRLFTTPNLHFRDDKKFPQKMGFVTFICLLNPSFL